MIEQSIKILPTPCWFRHPAGPKIKSIQRFTIGYSNKESIEHNIVAPGPARCQTNRVSDQQGVGPTGCRTNRVPDLTGGAAQVFFLLHGQRLNNKIKPYQVKAGITFAKGRIVRLCTFHIGEQSVVNEL